MKVAICGAPAAGKSTLAVDLGARLGGIPVHHVDQLRWAGVGERRSRPDVERLVDQALRGDSWVAEGMLGPTVNEFIRRADVILVLDYALARLAWHVVKRWTRPESRIGMPQGHRDRPSWEAIQLLWRWRTTLRDHLRGELTQPLRSQVIVMRSPRDQTGVVENLSQQA